MLTKLTFLVAAFSLMTMQLPGNEPTRAVPLDPLPGMFDVGDFRYVLSVVAGNDGQITRVGGLFHKGLPIAGSDFYRLEIPAGSFIWYPMKAGELEQGWSRIDPEKKHSQWTMAVIESAPKKDARILRTMPRDPLPDAKPHTKPPRPSGPSTFQ